MIEETKYYLGNVETSNDTTIMAYTHERGSAACRESCSGGDVWSGNSATWTGKIALLYPSDYGYSVSSNYWNNSYLNKYDYGEMRSSWLYQDANHGGELEYFLSPSTYRSYSVAMWEARVANREVYVSGAIRPCLYLKSEVKIIEGDGSSLTPYQLKYDIN